MNDDLKWRIIQDATSNALNDQMWQVFGYARRPRFGAIFGFLRSRWKLELEQRILRELTYTPIAVHVIADRIDFSDVESIVATFLTMPSIPETMGYSDIDLAIRDMFTAVRDYSETPVENWARRLRQRLKIDSLPDNKLAAKLLAGAIRYESLSELAVAGYQH